jgi:hypothetical protein
MALRLLPDRALPANLGLRYHHAGVSGLTGELSVMSLADLLIWLANRSKTGVLILERDYIHKEITLESGAVVRASSNDPREYLGQFLMSFGLITEEQLQRAFQTQQETKVLLGRILVMIGTVAEDQVIRTLEVKMRETLLDAMRWTSGRFEFTDSELSSDRPEIEVAVPLLQIHREGAQRAPIWAQFHAQFPKPTLAIAVNEARLPPGLRADTLDGRIITLSRGGYTIEAMATELRATDFHLYTRLYELHRIGALEPYEPGMRTRTVTGVMRAPLASADTINTQPSHLGDVAGVPIARGQPDGVESAVPILLRPLDEVLKHRSSTRERYILTHIDGVRTIGAILQVSPMRDTEALDIFKSLAGAGLIRF